MDKDVLEYINSFPAPTQAERVKLALVSLVYELVKGNNVNTMNIGTPKKTKSKVKKDDGNK